MHRFESALRIAKALVFLSLCFLYACSNVVSAPSNPEAVVLGPDDRLGELFDQVQMQQIFPDGKTFADARAKTPDSLILKLYKAQSTQAGFDLKAFVLQHFEIPGTATANFVSDTSKLVQEHIRDLWPVLTRKPDAVVAGSTLLPLPYAYVVPGGRFREIYYWDSYFTMLGLQQDGRGDLIRNMVDNFAFLITTYGHIPNGNRSYYLSRSQPPFFAAMVNLLANMQGDTVYARYLPALEKEYAFWMADSAKVTSPGMAQRRVVRMPDGTILNRYYDDKNTPRAESYREDVLLQKESGRPGPEIWRDIRAAAESGWDFSSRWLLDGKTLSTIRTTAIIPVDLNTLMCNMEMTLADAYRATNQEAKRVAIDAASKRRQAAIMRYCWDQKSGFFMDYDFKDGIGTGIPSLAAAFPLFFGLATQEQAALVSKKLESDFLGGGGFVTTPFNTGQQWDAPNGWAPLQWICINGLERYGYTELSHEATMRWSMLNAKVYRSTGKMLEKYNVIDLSLIAGGGEYPVQDGFGWSNGVLQALLSRVAPKNLK